MAKSVNELTVTIIGAGTMGHGIAQVMAMAGHEVTIHDIEEAVLENASVAIEENLQGGIDRGKVTVAEKEATLDRLSYSTDLEAATSGADLVIEAVPEAMELKQSVFEDIEGVVDSDTVIGTNTSSLSVTEIASALDRQDRAIGVHFFNPVHILPLVEVVVPAQATDNTVDFAISLVENIQKEPIVVQDSPGFASSRLGVALAVEAMRMVESGVASVADIDRAMTLGYNHPMGPLELTDVVGLDVRLDILEHLREELGERFRPPQILHRKVRAGDLGQKTGRGFYRWDDGERIGIAGEDA